jgi:hypothetical protein
MESFTTYLDRRNMEISPILKNKWVQASALSAATFVGGIVTGYFWGRKEVKLVVVRGGRTEPEPEQMTIFEVTETFEVEVEASSPEEAREIADEAIAVTVFRSGADDWDYEAELATRVPERPYVIHQDEFVSNESGFHQDTLTYYERDDIMADSDDTPLYDYKKLMGDLLFGHGTNDPNVVYIRNEKLELEWEILLHTGSFSEEVLGVEIEREEDTKLQHSVLKMRRE